MKKQYLNKSKNEGALSKRFIRHRGIYRSDVSSLLVNLGQSAAIRSVPGQAIGRAGRNTPCPSSAMSSARLFLDGVLASIAHLRFTGFTTLKRLPHPKKQIIIER
jgi:hypothetical protein